MSDDSSRNLSSRVFHVDRECYVVYVGTADHRFRPFLRLGTSEWLPDKVKRHVSNVVITDHLTGNPQYEPNCLEKPVSHDMRYVGTTTLVNSVKQFVHDQNIASRPISPPKKEEAERQGAHVLFYSDGNVRIIVDGREILDLSKREKSDRHAVFELRRLNELAASSGGSYFASSLRDPGFVYLTDGSLLLFDNGSVELRRLCSDGIDALARRLLPLELIKSVSGPVERGGFVDLCKWRLRRKEKLAVAISDSGDGAASSSEIEDFLTLLTKAGLRIERGEPMDLPPLISTLLAPLAPKERPLRVEDSPKPPNAPGLALPEGVSWLAKVSAPLLPGAVYRLPGKERESLENSERETLYGVLSDAVKKQIELPQKGAASPQLISSIQNLLQEAAGAEADESSSDALILRLLLWNLIVEMHWGGSKHDGLRALAGQISSEWQKSLSTLPLPLSVTFHPRQETVTVTFSLPQGFTKGKISENRRVLQKIDSFIERRQETSYYQGERKRLESFLASLLEKQKVAPVAPPKPKPQETGESDTQASEREKSESEPEAQAAGGAAARAGGGAAAGARGQKSSPAPGGSSGESSRGRRVPVLIAGVVVLLLAGAGALIYFGGVPEALLADGSDAPREASPGQDSGETAEGDESSSPGEPSPGSEGAEGGSPGDDEGTGEEAPEGADNETVAVGNGGFEVTLLDVIIFVNRVAEINGYEPLGAVAPDGRDPDWIFPGNRLELPDGSVRVVQRGDTMWDISREFLLRYVDEHHQRFLELQETAETGEPPVGDLENLLEEVYVESLREAITDFLESL